MPYFPSKGSHLNTTTAQKSLRCRRTREDYTIVATILIRGKKQNVAAGSIFWSSIYRLQLQQPQKRGGAWFLSKGRRCKFVFPVCLAVPLTPPPLSVTSSSSSSSWGNLCNWKDYKIKLLLFSLLLQSVVWSRGTRNLSPLSWELEAFSFSP